MQKIGMINMIASVILMTILGVINMISSTDMSIALFYNCIHFIISIIIVCSFDDNKKYKKLSN